MSTRGFRARAVYYPYFHVRDDRWLKVAALYWPSIVRIVPEDYPTRDSETVRVLAGELNFIERQAPGASVDAIEPRFLALVAQHGPSLRERLGIDLARARAVGTAFGSGDRVGAVHTGQIAPRLTAALVDAGLAVSFRVDLSGETDRDWMVMDERLVSAYAGALADDFARANRLLPTTDQPAAFVVAHDWTAQHLAAALLDIPGPPPTQRAAPLEEVLALLTLRLVVPANLDRVPASAIVEVRRRFGAEFLAFGAEIDRAAADLAELADIRDRRTLERYLREEIAHRFEEPMHSLRRHLIALQLNPATSAINAKVQLPAATALGGAWLSGHELIAGGAAALVGLLAMRQGLRQRHAETMRASPVAAYLLNTRAQLAERGLLGQTLAGFKRVAGLA
ncbi:hypothetical protein GCM10023322_12240 [Rugosimonospora acidiphila]|uniref:DUF2236 domain-containing protein n=1 Tax=Rugosimonospora acidiphila TaxID=556531 RepID=A0ABP9RMF5_9ACTN